MVSHLVFYQLMFLGLLWLCVMLHYAWPNEWPCTCPLRINIVGSPVDCHRGKKA
jgi:hypothetical protein